jgi:hypothetical protein
MIGLYADGGRRNQKEGTEETELRHHRDCHLFGYARDQIFRRATLTPDPVHHTPEAAGHVPA